MSHKANLIRISEELQKLGLSKTISVNVEMKIIQKYPNGFDVKEVYTFLHGTKTEFIIEFLNGDRHVFTLPEPGINFSDNSELRGLNYNHLYAEESSEMVERKWIEYCRDKEVMPLVKFIDKFYL